MTNKDETERAAGLARWRLRAILIGLAILGVVLNFLAPYSFISLEPIIREFGAALIVAAVIGGTVDLFFKEEFARDVFVAAFRYVLPDELKEEVRRIISYKFLCVDGLLIVKIEPIPDTELVRLNVSMERTIKNITRHPEVLPVIFTVDEWGFSGHRSKIDQCDYDVGNGLQSCEDDPYYADTEITIGKKSEVRVNAGQTIKIIMKGSEIRRENCELREFHANPAVNPVVEIRAPEDFRYGCTFGVPGEKINPSKIDAIYRLEGTQFPGQCTHIRWWRFKRDGQS